MPRCPSYSCRQFRFQHVEYVDGFLGDEALRACDAHLEECPACRRHDVRIRRSLLALQVLPVIEPSADFRLHLGKRLAAETRHRELARRSTLAATTRFQAAASIG